MSEDQKRRDGHSALRPDGNGGLETFDKHPETKFLCGLVAEGQPACAEQCARCLAAETGGATVVPPVNHEAPGPAAEAKPAVIAELHVVLFADGNFQVSGPLDNPFHYHGLLGIAADALRDIRARQAASRIDLSAGKKGPGFLKRLLAGRREAQGILKKGG
jgi:hypothetical protein